MDQNFYRRTILACKPSAVCLILCFVGSVVFMDGCTISTLYYYPNTHNVPLFQEEGNAAFSLSVEEVNGFRGTDWQGAYAVTDRLAFMLNLSSFDLDRSPAASDIKIQFIELGPGYYLPRPRNTVFEVYGLIGGGNVENRLVTQHPFDSSTSNGDQMSSGTLESKFFKYGIQAAIGYVTPCFDFAVSARMAMLNYYNISGDLILFGEDQVQSLEEKDRHLLVERAITLRGGCDFMKLQFQWGGGKNLSHPDFRQDRNTFSVGVSYAFK